MKLSWSCTWQWYLRKIEYFFIYYFVDEIQGKIKYEKSLFYYHCQPGSELSCRAGLNFKTTRDNRTRGDMEEG
jgi:hypothetical protein